MPLAEICLPISINKLHSLNQQFESYGGYVSLKTYSIHIDNWFLKILLLECVINTSAVFKSRNIVQSYWIWSSLLLPWSSLLLPWSASLWKLGNCANLVSNYGSERKVWHLYTGKRYSILWLNVFQTTVNPGNSFCDTNALFRKLWM